MFSDYCSYTSWNTWQVWSRNSWTECGLLGITPFFRLIRFTVKSTKTEVVSLIGNSSVTFDMFGCILPFK